MDAWDTECLHQRGAIRRLQPRETQLERKLDLLDRSVSMRGGGGGLITESRAGGAPVMTLHPPQAELQLVDTFKDMFVRRSLV